MGHPTVETAKGLSGLGAMTLAQLTSLQPDLAWSLRIASLLAGLYVAYLTAKSMKKRRGRD